MKYWILQKRMNGDIEISRTLTNVWFTDCHEALRLAETLTAKQFCKMRGLKYAVCPIGD